jgi:hypothetical protein
MEHEQATLIQAPERYLLGELSDAERDRFEEHFFDCAACAEEVRTGVLFEANAQAVFAQQALQRLVEPSWRDWLCLRPAFAGAVACLLVTLLGGFSYEALVARGLHRELAELRAPQSYPSSFLRSATRGGEQVIEAPSGKSGFLGLSVDLSPEQSFGQYLGEVWSESGAVLFTVPLKRPPKPGDHLNLLIPASSLEPGRPYTLVIRGLQERPTGRPGIEIARYAFVTQRN